MADPASEAQQRKVEAAIDAASIAFELGILAIIAERIGTLGNMSISEIYAAMPEDINRINNAVKKGTESITKTADKIIKDMAAANDDWADKYYKARNVEQVAAEDHPLMNRTLKQNTESLNRKVKALCRSTVFAIGDKRWSPTEQGYKRVISNIANDMVAGDISIDQAVSQAVKGMAKNGLRVMYSSGNTRNLHTAIRTNVMDAYRTTMSELREIQGKEFGADGVEVTAHALCAPDHLPYQGMRYSYERRRGYDLWDDIQNEPKRPLVTGANCGHTVFPVILDVSSPAYTREELDELKRRSNEKIEFEGLSGETLSMSRYDASQYQRKMENRIRDYKKEAYLQKISKEGNPEHASKAALELTRKYKSISENMGLSPRLDLLRIYTPI